MSKFIKFKGRIFCYRIRVSRYFVRIIFFKENFYFDFGNNKISKKISLKNSELFYQESRKPVKAIVFNSVNLRQYTYFKKFITTLILNKR